MTRQLNNRRGFTLVELLVVIGIIGLLAAISVPIVMQSLTKARNAAIKAEIDMLHMAIMNYKNEYGSFPPSEAIINGSDRATRHLQRIFPRATNAYLQARCLPFRNAMTPNPFDAADVLTIDTALFAWLSGFNNDPTAPILSASTVNVTGASPTKIFFSGAQDRKRLYEFDQSRISSNFQYYPSGKPGSPFLYVDAPSYSPTLGEPLGSASKFNPDTFQILCAGRDEEFGTDDDLSNFWPGTRREYEDSLKN